MVRALRDEEAARLAPQHGVADIERLAGPTRDGPHGSVGVEAALYRIAQESITNEVRHARGATRVSVDIHAEEGGVRLTVKDDGTAAPLRASWGFGLVGMAERAAISGGKLEAGPRDGAVPLRRSRPLSAIRDPPESLTSEPAIVLIAWNRRCRSGS